LERNPLESSPRGTATCTNANTGDNNDGSTSGNPRSELHQWRRLPGSYDTVADIINSANQQSLAQIALSSEADTARAIEAAAAAFPHGA
jgi:hypothetical protein